MFEKLYAGNRDLMLVGGVFAILVILFAPIPAAMLDFAIIVNFGFGLTILLLTFYVAKPVDFSTFPSLLLVVTLFRLSINVAATRLILTGAYAGDVINSIGEFAVLGNFVIGIVVFSILVVVQYVVVTSGAQRVSEVAARFTLDSMPGQQMSIDADLNMGLIDQTEAQRRRHGLEKEASFYGAMDGASKFVKGDAIAAIIIMLINLIAGSLIGIIQLGLSWPESLQRFTLLTIGDGIAAQLPALIIAIATGIIVTRSSADKDFSTEVYSQLASVPRIPLIVGAALTVLMLLPGMPKWPIIIMLLAAALVWWRARKAKENLVEAALTSDVEDSPSTSGDVPGLIEIALGRELGELLREQRPIILDRIANIRQSHGRACGAPLPAVRVVDGDGIGENDYEVRLFGSRFGLGTIMPGMVMAIAGNSSAERLEGIETIDPAFGLKAYWITLGQEQEARAANFTVVDPVSLIMTHFAEVVAGEASSLLTRQTMVDLIDQVRARQSGLVEDLIPTLLSLADVQRILQNLLAESVPITNIDLILEILIDLSRNQRDPHELTEMLRQRMGHTICNQLRGRHRDLAVLSLDPRLENQVATNAGSGTYGAFGVEPRLAETLIRHIAPLADDMFRQGRAPVLLCAAEVRRIMKTLTRRAIPRLAVVSVNEVPTRIDLASFAVVKTDS
ncbi:MAG: flagellar biosynthesis protein FlhA [Pseudomonadota bacterium]